MALQKARKWQKFLPNPIFLIFEVRCIFLSSFMFLTIFAQKLHQKPEKKSENEFYMKMLKNLKKSKKSILA